MTISANSAGVQAPLLLRACQMPKDSVAITSQITRARSFDQVGCMTRSHDKVRLRLSCAARSTERTGSFELPKRLPVRTI